MSEFKCFMLNKPSSQGISGLMSLDFVHTFLNC